ncbi:AI-2E family transporter [Candidatus Palauibacter sp.]|uniref:AI-2E family transporter n=1 Tax=Candidatus Palauibacter sp. TaxID=3101350 RepID=UPI003B5C1C8C
MTDPSRKPPLDPARFRAVFLLLLVVGISLLFLEMIRPFLTALFLGAILSGLLYPAYRALGRWFGGREGLASFAALMLFVFLLLAPTAAFLGIVANQAVHVTQSAGPWIEEMQARLREPGGIDRLIDGIPWMESLRPYQDQVVQKLGEVAGSMGGFVVQGLTGITTATVRIVFLLFVMLYAMFFFLKDGRGVLHKVLYYLPLSDEDEKRMLDRFVSVTRAMVKGTFLIGIVQGGLAGLAFWVVGIPSAAFWGTVMAVLSIVPGVGSALVWLPAAIYLLASGQTIAGIGLILWCGLVVGTLDNLMRPWLVGRDTRMPDLMILLGTLGGLFAFGMAGVLIGPIVAALFITVWELYGESFQDILPATAFATAAAAEIDSEIDSMDDVPDPEVPADPEPDRPEA